MDSRVFAPRRRTGFLVQQAAGLTRPGAVVVDDGAVERVEAFLQRDGELALCFAMAARSHAGNIRPVGGTPR